MRTRLFRPRTAFTTFWRFGKRACRQRCTSSRRDRTGLDSPTTTSPCPPGRSCLRRGCADAGSSNEHSVVRLALKVVPGSSKNAIAGWLGDTLKVRVSAAPERGKANDAVEALIADALRLPADRVRIVAGA